MKIYPYSGASKSAKALAEALGCKRLKREGGVIGVDILINWGCSAIHRDIRWDVLLNPTQAVARAANKLETFKCLDGRVSIPEWTEAVPEAQKWLAGGAMVFARTKLNGNSGAGIVILENEEDLKNTPAPLYTKYVNKDQEYRVHVFRGKVIMLQRKARKIDVPDDEVNWKIRNHSNGFIFAHKNVELAAEHQKTAIDAVAHLGLDFGAVDLMTDKKGKAYVLEVNTACGLEGTTLERYAEAFRDAA